MRHVVEGHMRRIVQFCILFGALVGSVRYALKVIGGPHPANLEGVIDVVTALLFLVTFYGTKALKIASKLSALAADQLESAKYLLSDWAGRLAAFLETDFLAGSVQSEKTMAEPTRFGKLSPWLAFALVLVSVTVMVAAATGRDPIEKAKEARTEARTVVSNSREKSRDFAEHWNDFPYACAGCGGPVVDEDDPRLSKDRIPLPRPNPLRRPRSHVR
jgi:hypothetical protein